MNGMTGPKDFEYAPAVREKSNHEINLSRPVSVASFHLKKNSPSLVYADVKEPTRER
jgi:hypothetical protein